MILKIGKKKEMTLLTLSILVYLAAPVYAAEEAVTTRDVMVTATRTEQEIRETPASAEVITREDIEALGADSVISALKLATNLNLSKAGMVGNAVSLRGMNTSQTLILINGRRMAGEDTAETANAYELDRINIANVERIEIVRGPVSSLYGSDALGGVINIITRRSEKPQTTLDLSTGTEQKNASIRLDLGKQGNWNWAFDARFTEVRDRTYASGDTTMYGPRQYFNIDGTYDLGDGKKLNVFADRMTEHLNERYANTSTSKNKKERFDNARNAYGVSYTGKTANSDYEVRAYYNQLEKESAMTSNGVFSDFDHAKYETWVIDGKESVQLNDDHLFTYGGEYRQSSYRGTRLGEGGEHIFEQTHNGLTKKGSEATIDYQAVYLQDEWVASDRLLVIPSLRYDNSDKFGDNISPKLGMTYKLNDTFRLKANVGTGFKAPTISELYMNMRRTMGPMLVEVSGNPDLKPEKSRSYELSLEGDDGTNFGKLTYFNNKVEDLINTKTTAGFVPGVGMLMKGQYVNIDQAEVNGVEFELGRQLDKNFGIKATYNYLDATDTSTGARLENRAKYRSTMQLTYSEAKAFPLSATLWNEWVRGYRYDQKDYSYSMLNFSVNKKWNENYSTYIGLDNILDKKVEDLNVEGMMWRFGVKVGL